MIADVLGRDECEVVSQAELMKDLGAESIELLEMSWRCEKQFGVALPFQKLMGDPGAIDSEGFVTPQGLAALKLRMLLPVETLGARPKPEDLKRLLTVGAVERYIAASLRGELGDRASAPLSPTVTT